MWLFFFTDITSDRKGVACIWASKLGILRIQINATSWWCCSKSQRVSCPPLWFERAHQRWWIKGLCKLPRQHCTNVLWNGAFPGSHFFWDSTLKHILPYLPRKWNEKSFWVGRTSKMDGFVENLNAKPYPPTSASLKKPPPPLGDCVDSFGSPPCTQRGIQCFLSGEEFHNFLQLP